jgi:aminopeptidase N
VKATKVITFNAISELGLDSATLLVASSGAELEPAGTKFELDTERASLIFTEEIPAGSKATLRVGFRSSLTDSMTGYYRSTWEKGIYALTQFEVRVASSYLYLIRHPRWFNHRSGVREPKRLDLRGPWRARTDDLRVAYRCFPPKAHLLSLQTPV